MFTEQSPGEIYRDAKFFNICEGRMDNEEQQFGDEVGCPNHRRITD